MYVVRIKRDGREHTFQVPAGYDNKDPIISQLNIYSRTFKARLKDIGQDDIAFLSQAFNNHPIPYVKYQAYSCLAEIFRHKPELFSPNKIWELIESGEERSFNAFTAYSIDMAATAIYSETVKRKSPFLKHIFRQAAEGKNPETRNLALSTLNQIAEHGPEYIRQFLFEQSRRQIHHSIENAAKNSEPKREYYENKGLTPYQIADKGNTLNKKEEKIFDDLNEKDTEIEDLASQNRVTYWETRQRLAKEKYKIESPEQLIAYLKVVLKKNAYHSSRSIAAKLFEAAPEFLAEAHDFLKDYILDPKSDGKGLALSLARTAIIGMTPKDRKERKLNHLNLVIQALPFLSDDEIQDTFGSNPRDTLNYMGIRKLPQLSEEQKETLRKHLQLCADEIGDISLLPALSKLAYNKIPNEVKSYLKLAEFYRYMGGRDYVGVDTHEKMVLESEQRAQAWAQQQAQKRRERRDGKGNTTSPSSQPS